MAGLDNSRGLASGAETAQDLVKRFSAWSIAPTLEGQWRATRSMPHIGGVTAVEAPDAEHLRARLGELEELNTRVALQTVASALRQRGVPATAYEHMVVLTRPGGMDRIVDCAHAAIRMSGVEVGSVHDPESAAERIAQRLNGGSS
ncbi:hypothetical protein ABZ801_00895 [Actinomadura sp. NPDC047616]|uniref:hypothetical protein n=1 Tax=Actinomadura sp. NPDC047616 TaxID=3155914 RepID=UPI00340C66FC